MKYLVALIIAAIMACTNQSMKAEPIELTERNAVVLKGEVSSKSMAELSYQLSTNKQEKVYLFISSGGGSVFPGLKFVRFLKTLNKDVVCIADIAGSMAFTIFQSCKTRYIMEDTLLMQHVSSYQLAGQEPNNYRFAKFMRKVAKFLLKLDAKQLNMSTKTLYNKVRDDWWLFGSEALEYNAADEVVSVKCADSLATKTKTQTIRGMFASATITWSKCPLISAPVKIQSQIFGSPTKGAKELKRLLKKLNPRKALLNRKK